MSPKEKNILKQNTYKTSHSHVKEVMSSLVKNKVIDITWVQKKKKILKQNTYKTSHPHVKEVMSSLVKNKVIDITWVQKKKNIKEKDFANACP